MQYYERAIQEISSGDSYQKSSGKIGPHVGAVKLLIPDPNPLDPLTHVDKPAIASTCIAWLFQNLSSSAAAPESTRMVEIMCHCVTHSKVSLLPV
ncbi:ADM_HP2_G0042370.mRNA.1.CDS.1 [Saccharomyces cerevisiae]|nr:ADM_HP2_G0042370.mRNA.1.CDS.1 [Saccharomyces cerevisiae]CAI6636364.1 ADM_HP2_G0042370.mRNA.1.CDS.1 [Saccharomyces cerevisiae]